MRKQYTLFAGVNGAGKTSMYRALYLESKNMGYRINILNREVHSIKKLH